MCSYQFCTEAESGGSEIGESICCSVRKLEDDLDNSKFELSCCKGLVDRWSSEEEVSRFLDELKGTLESVGMTRSPIPVQRKMTPLPRKLRRLAKAKRKVQKKKQKGMTLMLEEQSVMKECKEAIKRFKEERKLREIRVGIESQIHNNNSGRLWDWIDKQLHHVEKQAMAIRDPNTGVVHTDEERVVKLWSEHYRKLGSKEDGHSKDGSYWIGKAVNKPENEGMCANEKYWDGDINWFEVREAVRVMSNGKGGWIDGIP